MLTVIQGDTRPRDQRCPFICHLVEKINDEKRGNKIYLKKIVELWLCFLVKKAYGQTKRVTKYVSAQITVSQQKNRVSRTVVGIKKNGK